MSEARSHSWVMRAAGPGDLDELRTLYRATWGYNRPESFDRWRYLNPPDGECPVMLAIDGERFVGAYTLWPVRLRIGREVILGAQSMDTMTHPDYQGQGIFTALAQACFELAVSRGFEIVYGFPNPLSYPGFVKRLGFDHTGDIAHWIRPLKLSKHPRVPPAAGPVADLATRILPSGSRRSFEIVVGRPKEAPLADLLADWRARTNGCAIERDQRWLDWRYSAASQNDYEWLCAYRNGSLAAAGIWGMRNQNWGTTADSRAHITELFATDRRAGQAIVSQMIMHARARGAMLIETISGMPDIVSVLRRCGFVSHRKAPYIVRALKSRAFDADIRVHGGWHIVGGDVDTF